MQRIWYFAAAVALAAPVFAQAPDGEAAQNASNWDVFLKLYPKRALEAKEEGAVGFKVTLDSKGAVTNCKVTHSSGHPLLDGETCNLVTLNAVFKADPTLSPSQVRTHEGLIAWKLPGSTTKLEAPKAVAASGLDEVVCKKSVRTGSLVATERTCLSRREWGRQADAMKEPWDEIQGRKGSTHGN